MRQATSAPDAISQLPDLGLRAQSGARSGAILHALAHEPLSANDLMALLGLKTKTGAFKRSVNELIDGQLIERTIPDKPNSRLQKYRITPKGRALIAQ
jgi:ATP-dependent DNA helicase RecG